MARVSSSAQLKETLKQLILQHVRRKLDKPIRLASGSLTQEYFDAKQITLFPSRMLLFARWILESVSFENVEAIGGMSIGADPIVSSLSMTACIEKQMDIPAFYVRKESKQHGLQKSIEGVELKRGMRVMIVEDVITKGTSTLKAIEIVQSLGAKIEQVVCMVDREAGGRQKIAAIAPVTALFTKSELAS